MTVGDLRALKGKRQLTMLYIDTIDEAAAESAAQYLFAEDVLGYSRGHQPRHAKVFRNFCAEYDRLQFERVAASQEFRADVETGADPEARHTVPIADVEFEAFMTAIETRTTGAPG